MRYASDERQQQLRFISQHDFRQFHSETIVMTIYIRQQCWNRVAQQLKSMDADEVADKLRKLGHDVEIIDGDMGASYVADSADEHNALRELNVNKPK
jgi:hypothetical protein